jgi:hypothetical protein
LSEPKGVFLPANLELDEPNFALNKHNGLPWNSQYDVRLSRDHNTMFEFFADIEQPFPFSALRSNAVTPRDRKSRVWSALLKRAAGR